MQAIGLRVKTKPISRALKIAYGLSRMADGGDQQVRGSACRELADQGVGRGRPDNPIF
jgi:hypothetical protein